MLHDVRLRLVLIRRRLWLEHSRWVKPVGARDGRLLRGDEGGGHHSCADSLCMDVVARSRQFLLALVVVVVEFVHSISVTMHLLSHGVVWAGLAKCGVLFIGSGRRASDLLGSLVVKAVDVKLVHVIAAEAHRPAVRAGDIRAERAGLGHVAIRRGQHGVFCTRVMVLKPLLMGSEGERPITKVLGPVKVTGLIEHRVANVLCVLLERGEATLLAECKLLLGDRIVQSHNCQLITAGIRLSLEGELFYFY